MLIDAARVDGVCRKIMKMLRTPKEDEWWENEWEHKKQSGANFIMGTICSPSFPLKTVLPAAIQSKKDLSMFINSSAASIISRWFEKMIDRNHIECYGEGIEWGYWQVDILGDEYSLRRTYTALAEENDDEYTNQEILEKLMEGQDDI